MLRRLLTLEGDKCELVFELERQGAVLTGTIVVHGDEWSFAAGAEDILAQLELKKLRQPLPGAVEELVRMVEERRCDTRVTIATGTEPVEPADGRIDFAIRPFSITHPFDENAQGDVDFHQAAEINTAQPGDTVATIVAPVPGQPGLTVTGEPIRVAEAKPAQLAIGDGVARDGDRVVATAEGRVIFENGTVSVSEEYVVQGDVGFATGNIQFRGYVIIRGDVTDGFTVNGQKGVTVSGVIGAADVASDGSIECHGIAGQGKGRISAGGDVAARYISAASIRCRNLDVENEIYNATVSASGTVRVSKGTIVGGEVIALGGIDTRSAGTEAGIKTILSAGMSSDRIAEILALKQEMVKLEDIAPRMEGAMAKSITDQIASLRMRIKTLQIEKEPGSVARICIRGHLLDNVTVYLEPLKRVMERAEGPLTLAVSADWRRIVTD